MGSLVTNAGIRITLVCLMARSAGYGGPKIDQKTPQGNQHQVHGPTDSFLPRRNRRFLFECARWSNVLDTGSALVCAVDRGRECRGDRQRCQSWRWGPSWGRRHGLFDATADAPAVTVGTFHIQASTAGEVRGRCAKGCRAAERTCRLEAARRHAWPIEL
jgi:hypothetical protein